MSDEGNSSCRSKSVSVHRCEASLIKQHGKSTTVDKHFDKVPRRRSKSFAISSKKTAKKSRAESTTTRFSLKTLVTADTEAEFQVPIHAFEIQCHITGVYYSRSIETEHCFNCLHVIIGLD